MSIARSCALRMSSASRPGVMRSHSARASSESQSGGLVGASRVKFGGCGTTGHRLAIEAGDADEIDAEPEGRGLAGCWGRVRVLHCCRRWRLHGLAAVGRSQLLDASRGPVGEEAAQEGVGEGQVTPDGAARPRR